jgi:hypothetical protein
LKQLLLQWDGTDHQETVEDEAEIEEGQREMPLLPILLPKLRMLPSHFGLLL